MNIQAALTFFIGFTGSLSLLMTLGELVRKERSPLVYIQAGLFFLAAIFQFHSYLVCSDLHVFFPDLYMMHLPFTSLFGSLLVRYFSVLWNEEKKIETLRFFEVIPPILVILLLSDFYLSSTAQKLNAMEHFAEIGLPIPAKLAITIAVIPILFAGFYVFMKLFRYLRWQTIKESAHLRLVLYVIVIVVIASMTGLFNLYNQKRHGLEVVSGLIGILLIIVHLLRQRNPELLGEVSRIVIEEKKYQISQLKSVNVDELRKKLNILMEEKKFYRNDEITLSELSTELSVSQHQLSEFLNQHLGKNFFQYLNFYRIREAKELCKTSPEKTILSIAYDVGFPSKSTFYDAFKRETGMSPTEYRKSKHPN
jgi:AraC-like DNA-binding protein